ncbi:MAG TPA: hypothetical protein VGR90_06470, partial [Acidimicrobiales bacterium]|nr:hypothetical protein [Acidimicrobiales bacterium]
MTISSFRRGWRRWSLRRRVLVVLAGLVAVGLLLADLATYHTLRSYLIHREDTQLDGLAQGAGRTLDFAARFGGFGGTVPAPDGLLGGTSQAFIQLRDPSGAVVETVQAHRADTAAIAPPRLPSSLPTPPAPAAGPSS